MKIQNITIVALAAITMCGCKGSQSLYSKYERPDSVRVDGIVRDPVNNQAMLASADTTSFGNLPWREVFTDPQLQNIIQRTLDNNPDLLNAALNIDIAENQLKAAKLAFLPTVQFSATGTLSHYGTHSETAKIWQAPISASWTPDLFGKLRSQKREAQAALMQMEDYKVATQTALICNVAQMYYTLLMLDKETEIIDNMTGLTKDTWDMMKLQMEYGGARATSVQSAEAGYYSVLAQGVEIKKSIRETENALSLLMGEPAHSIARSTLDAQSLPESFATGVGIQLLSNRADVHAYEMALAQCFYNVQQARANFYPNITISGTGGFSNSNGLVNPAKWLWNAVGSLVQPIFMNGQLTAGLRVAEDQYKQAYNNWQNSVLSAGSEVSNYLVAYNSAKETSELEQKQIDLYQKTVEHTELLYRQSSSNYLEVITAQQNLLNAQISKVQDDFAKMQAVVNLYYALGGGRK